jgi:endonuclease YncB( thermonuclease family)
VGRDVSAATDAGLKAEVLSYARSRGLFVGASIDGSALEIDNASHLAFYGSQSSELPHQIPQAAAKLRQDLVHLTPNAQPIAGPQATTNPPIRTQNPARLHALRGSLEQSSRQLLTVVSPEWQRYLALPTDVYSPGGQPQLDLLRKALGCYDQVAKNADYQSLTSHPEFQRTHELLREYTDELSAVVDAAIKLPPPPVAGEHEFTGKVLEVIDGDTIKVMHDGKPEVVRLSDINAPKLAQPHGDKAKKYAEELCLGDQARVVWERRDSEGRIVGSVDEEDEGLNVNLEMVKAGLAWDVAEDDWTLAKAESEARKAKLGVWADRHPIPPWEFQKQHKQPTSTAPEFNDASQPGTAGRILAPIRW